MAERERYEDIWGDEREREEIFLTPSLKIRNGNTGFDILSVTD